MQANVQIVQKNQLLTVNCQSRVHDGFILYLHYIYYDITMRLVCDNYVIYIPCLYNTLTTPLPLAEDMAGELRIDTHFVHFVHFWHFHKIYKVPKMYKMYSNIY